jgi:hypothetical protein
MNFFEFYESLETATEQRELRAKIYRRCRITKPTFYNWLRTRHVPNIKNRALLASICSKPQTELFPQPANTL